VAGDGQLDSGPDVSLSPDFNLSSIASVLNLQIHELQLNNPFNTFIILHRGRGIEGWVFLLKLLTRNIIPIRNGLNMTEDMRGNRHREELVRASEEKYRLLVDNVPGAVSIFQGGKIVFANKKAGLLLGYTEEEMMGMDPFLLAHPDDRENVRKYVASRASGKSAPESYVFRSLTRDGAVRWVDRHIVPIAWNGEPGYLMVDSDVTEQKLAEELQVQQAEGLSKLNRFSMELAALSAQDNIEELITRRIKEFTGAAVSIFSEYDPSAKTLAPRCVEMDPGMLEKAVGLLGRQVQNLRSAVSDEMYGEITTAIIGKRQTLQEVSFGAVPRPVGSAIQALLKVDRFIGLAYVVDGKLCGTSVFGMKKGEPDPPRQLLENFVLIAAVSLRRRQVEEYMFRTARDWRVTFDSLDDMIATIDTNYLIMRVNKSFASALGKSPRELIGKHCYEVVHGTSGPFAACPFGRLITTGKTETSEYFEPNLGKYIEVTVSPILDDEQKISGTVHIIKDQTAKRQALAEQQSLREKAEISSRLAAVGEMAAGIAHEINNPLTGVIGFSQLLCERQDLPEDAYRAVNIIADGSQRVADIVKKLLTFARQSKPVKTAANINDLIENTLKLRSYALKTSSIEVITHLDPGLPLIVVDPGQMQQVFLNLIVNAEHAIKEARHEGRLTVTSEVVDKCMRISFEDDGAGISPENLKHIFEPFFTTKPEGEGTGLGLSISRSIILEHNGELRVENEPGKGAKFIIELPLTRAPVEKAAPAPALPITETRRQKTARILVVDDELAVRQLISTIMTKSGHVVDDLGDPAQVLDCVTTTSYDAIFLDLRMPGISGMTLYNQIKQKAPKMAGRVIIITGDASSEDVQSFLKENRLPCITKPFTPRVVQARFNEIFKQGE
jgi:PAS domain S-box-containing protein